MFESTNSNRKPLLLAHRGSRLLAPENTSIAFDLALSHGSDVLEIDVRLSRDQRIIVTHDDTLDRTSDGTGRVRDMDLSNLKKLDAGFRFYDIKGDHYRGQGARFLTLDELLVAYPGAQINVDIKDKHNHAAYLIAQLLIKTDAIHRVNVGSFHASVIHAFRRYAPMITTAATQQETAKLYARSWLGKTNEVPLPHPWQHPYNVLQIPRNYRGLPLATRRFIGFLHQQQLPVMFWTINDPKVMRRLLRSGADGIVTDRTDLAKTVFLEHQQQQQGGTIPTDQPQTTIKKQ